MAGFYCANKSNGKSKLCMPLYQFSEFSCAVLPMWVCIEDNYYEHCTS